MWVRNIEACVEDGDGEEEEDTVGDIIECWEETSFQEGFRG